MEQVLSAAVVGVLEALGHDSRGLEVPQIHVLGPVTGDEEIEPAVSVVIQPDGAVGVHPSRKPSPFADRNKATSLFVVKQFRPAVLVQEKVLVAVVVVVSPESAHRDASADLVDVRDTHHAGHVHERAVTPIPVKVIQAPGAAVRHVEVLPPVAVEIRNGHRRAHRRDLGHDVLQPPVEGRSQMNRIDTDATSYLLQPKTVASHGIRIAGPMAVFGLGSVEHHHGHQRRKEHDGPQQPEGALPSAFVHKLFFYHSGRDDTVDRGTV